MARIKSRIKNLECKLMLMTNIFDRDIDKTDIKLIELLRGKFPAVNFRIEDLADEYKFDGVYHKEAMKDFKKMYLKDNRSAVSIVQEFSFPWYVTDKKSILEYLNGYAFSLSLVLMF